MKRWLLPILLVVVGTVLAIGAGYGANAALGSAIGLGDGEVLAAVKPSTTRKAEPAASDDGEPDTAEPDDGVADASDSRGNPSTPRAMPRRRYIDGIMDRNIFDSTAIGKEIEEEICEGDDCEYEASDLPVTLLTTVVAEPIEYSSALLYDDNRKEAAGYAVGDKILDATITRIEVNRVIVQRGDGREEYIVAGEGDVAQPDRGPTGPAPSAEEGVAKVSDDEYIIDRNLVDATLADLDAVSKMARARPHKDSDGNVDGFRLSGVRRNKLLYKIGIRSGDVVHTVNGAPLTSMQEAMGAWQSMQNSSNFEFEITRRGQKKTMKYQVR